MKLTKVNRLVLSGLLALGVAGGSLAPLVAGHAAAAVQCVRSPQGDRFCWHVEE